MLDTKWKRPIFLQLYWAIIVDLGECKAEETDFAEGTKQHRQVG